MADVNSAHVSPLKTFLRRHSPIKSRNKPLPAAPSARDESPTRGPLHQGDPNAKLKGAAEQAKLSKGGRFASIFRSSDKHADKHADGSRSSAAPKHQHSQSVPVARISRAAATEDHDMRGRVESPPSIRRLSAKISSLETQLQEAQRQLHAFAQVEDSSGPRPRPKSYAPRDRSCSSQTADEYQRRRSEYQYKPAPDRFDGFVESLLKSSALSHDDLANINLSGASHARRSSNPPTINRRASADVELAYERYLERQLAKETDARRSTKTPEPLSLDAPTSSPVSGEDTPQRQKRKRSELRESTWRQVQEHQSREMLAKQWERRSGDRKSNGYYEPRRSTVVAVGGETSERPSQRAKTRHDGPRDAVRDKSLPPDPKSPSPSPRRHRRSASQSHIDTANSRREQPVSKLPQAASSTSSAAANAPPSPSRRFATSPTKLLPVQEEFEWDEDVF